MRVKGENVVASKTVLCVSVCVIADRFFVYAITLYVYMRSHRHASPVYLHILVVLDFSREYTHKSQTQPIPLLDTLCKSFQSKFRY